MEFKISRHEAIGKTSVNSLFIMIGRATQQIDPFHLHESLYIKEEILIERRHLKQHLILTKIGCVVTLVPDITI